MITAKLKNGGHDYWTITPDEQNFGRLAVCDDFVEKDIGKLPDFINLTLSSQPFIGSKSVYVDFYHRTYGENADKVHNNAMYRGVTELMKQCVKKTDSIKRIYYQIKPANGQTA